MLLPGGTLSVEAVATPAVTGLAVLGEGILGAGGREAGAELGHITLCGLKSAPGASRLQLQPPRGGRGQGHGPRLREWNRDSLANSAYLGSRFCNTDRIYVQMKPARTGSDMFISETCECTM